MNKLANYILQQRLSPAEIKEFLKAYDDDYTFDSSTLLDLDKGGQLLYEHIKNGSIIISNSDYDADGVSAGGLLDIGLTAYFGVPKQNIIVLQNEREHGNGFNEYTKDKVNSYVSEMGASLLITGDHGSVDDSRYEQLDPSLDIIVTDHHTVPENEPKRPNVFINPQREGSTFDKRVSGATVVYLLLMEVYRLFLKNGEKPLIEDNLASLLPIPAITVFTDQMSLLSPINRNLVIKGLSILNNTHTKYPGNLEDSNRWSFSTNVDTMPINLEILLKKIRHPKIIDEDVVGFNIGPLLNGAGRLGKAHVSREFISERNPNLLLDIVDEMIELNAERKGIQNSLLQNALDQYRIHNRRFKNSLVIVQTHGHGVAGIIAGSIGDLYQLPTIVFTRIGDVLKGSGRAILNGVNIYKFITDNIGKFIIKGGGHKAAAGVEIKASDLDVFMREFDKFCKNEKVNGSKSLNEYIMTICPSRVGYDMVSAIDSIRPFGNGFRRPSMRATVTFLGTCDVGPIRNHALVEIQETKNRLFMPNGANIMKGYKRGEMINIIYTPSLVGGKIKFKIEEII